MNEPTTLLRIINNDGRAFHVRAVFCGMRYGLDDCLRHDGAPMIEFYDATQSADKFGARGQFVTRYYAETLAERGRYTTLSGANAYGLMLDGGVPEWVLTAANVREALAYCLSFITTPSTSAAALAGNTASVTE